MGGDEPDHERLTQIAHEARKRGEMFYYFPEGTQMKAQAKAIDQNDDDFHAEKSQTVKESEPMAQVHHFFERLESSNLEERRRKIAAGEVSDPWARPEPNYPAATSAGKKHEFVVENGSDNEEDVRPKPTHALSK